MLVALERVRHKFRTPRLQRYASSNLQMESLLIFTSLHLPWLRGPSTHQAMPKLKLLVESSVRRLRLDVAAGRGQSPTLGLRKAWWM